MTSRLQLASAQSFKMQSVVVATLPPMTPLQRANTCSMPTREFSVVMPSLDRDGLKLETYASETSDSGNFSPGLTLNSIRQNYRVRSPSSVRSPWLQDVLPVLATTVQPLSPNLCSTYNATVLGHDSGGSWQRSKNVSQSLSSSSLSQLRRQTDADESRNFVHFWCALLHSLTHDSRQWQCCESKHSLNAWLQQWQQHCKYGDEWAAF